LHFADGGLAVAGALAWGVGPAFEDVGDIDLVTSEAHRFDDACQQLAGGSDEWLALAVFIHAGRFANKHERGMNVSHSKHDVFPAGGQVGTFYTDGGAGAQGGHGGF